MDCNDDNDAFVMMSEQTAPVREILLPITDEGIWGRKDVKWKHCDLSVEMVTSRRAFWFNKAQRLYENMTKVSMEIYHSNKFNY